MNLFRPYLNFILPSREVLFDPRLLGTWRSDAEATLEALRRDSNVPPKAADTMARLIGRLTITYGEGIVTLVNCELAGNYRYRVLKQTDQKVVPESGNRDKATQRVGFTPLHDYIR